MTTKPSPGAPQIRRIRRGRPVLCATRAGGCGTGQTGLYLRFDLTENAVIEGGLARRPAKARTKAARRYRSFGAVRFFLDKGSHEQRVRFTLSRRKLLPGFYILKLRPYGEDGRPGKVATLKFRLR